MTLDLHPGQRLPSPEPPPAWGELAPVGQTALVLRLVLPDRVVSYPSSELRRWEQVAGTPEILTIHADQEAVVVEGTELALIRAALDLGRLCELRLTYPKRTSRPGPQVRRITIEPA